MDHVTHVYTWSSLCRYQQCHGRSVCLYVQQLHFIYRILKRALFADVSNESALSLCSLKLVEPRHVNPEVAGSCQFVFVHPNLSKNVSSQFPLWFIT